MSNAKAIKLTLGAALLAAALCFGYPVGAHREKPDLPIFPGAEKTRRVYLKMTPEDFKRDEAYGSVYPSVAQAQAALLSNPHDPQAHRTLARQYVQEMYDDRQYLSATLNSPQFAEAKNRLLAPAIAEYQAALVADPDNPVTKSNLAAAYAQTGQPAKAIAVYEQIKSYPPLEETAEIGIAKIQRLR